MRTDAKRQAGSVTFVVCVALFVSGCLMKQTTRDDRGIVTEEKYIIKRPIKNVIENLDVE